MPTLRIVSINDVYALDNLPRLKSLVRHHLREVHQGKADAIIVPLAGDFLAPSLLSSIDAGRGMVDCLNDVGVTHVILGNHEDDIPVEELRCRLKELRATCIGTNIRRGLDLPTHIVLDVGPDFRVALLGVVMIDEAVYRGRPFGGAEVVDPNVAAVTETQSLLSTKKVNAVIPLTHQSIAADKALTEMQQTPPYPVIVGGHEHTPMLVQSNGTWIVKAGSDAVQAVITEVTWSDDGSSQTTTTRLEAVSLYEEDAELRARVDSHMARVRELAAATLLYIPPNETLSSVGTRYQQTSIGTMICTKLRDALGAEMCLFNGGGIRGSRVYKERFTYGDVEAEVPFDNEVVVVSFTGRVVRDVVRVSRSHAPLESGSFLQVDDRVVIDPQTNEVTHIAGAPIDLDREYKVAIVRELLLGLDHVEPLTKWAKENPALVPPMGSGREPKMVLVQSFAVGIWHELGGFEAVDTNHDRRITAEEVAAAVARVHPSQAPSTVLADLIMRAIDKNADYVVSPDDFDESPSPAAASTASSASASTASSTSASTMASTTSASAASASSSDKPKPDC